MKLEGRRWGDSSPREHEALMCLCRRGLCVLPLLIHSPGSTALDPQALVHSLPSQRPEQKLKLREAVLSPRCAKWQLKTPRPPREAL